MQKTNPIKWISLLAILTLLVSGASVQSAFAAGLTSLRQDDTAVAPTGAATTIPAPTGTPTLTSLPPTDTPITPTPVVVTTTPTPTEDTTKRPVVLVESYSIDTSTLTAGQDFTLTLTLTNKGQKNAVNILITFAPGDLIPRDTGGTLSIYQLVPGESKTVTQPMTAGSGLAAGAIANVVTNVTYVDQTNSNAFTGAFNLAMHVYSPTYTWSGATSTPTVIVVQRPQLAITDYTTDVNPLQPGLSFNLHLQFRNLGNADARGVTLIMGGGSSSGAQDSSGTPQPGGVAGASGEFTNFAPLKSSNIHYIGDVATGQSVSIDQALIVNTTTNPGAYSVKFSFTYVDGKGAHLTDDQVITLLVYQLPLVEITFYHDPGPFYVGQPGPLPIQITNLSRKATVLGNMKASVAADGEITNASTLVGAMDAGGYFTLDSVLVPSKAGPMDIIVTVNYTDDFNQPQTITDKLPITVQDAPVEIGPNGTPGAVVPGGKPGEFLPSGNSEQGSGAPESFLDKVFRAVKGLIGLDSGQPNTGGSDGTAAPDSNNPGNLGGGGGGGGGIQVIPVAPLKGG
jgi:uncharacterized repeat protein (TIGR01451 family)